jgi:predicted acylesterase/phospholipase RssA
MGEPPSGVLREVDGNDLLRRMYYWEAPKAHRSIRLGRAVAASACVPGLFDPVEFANLYPKRIIRLVDGGVRDNQGTGSLLEQECSVLLVSDASGQSSSQNYPGAEPLQVPLRASGIQGARYQTSTCRLL